MGKDKIRFFSNTIETPIGSMVAIADEQSIYLLEFTDNKKIKHKIQKIQSQTDVEFTNQGNQPINQIFHELQNYFDGSLKEFKTPITILGSNFQRTVWQDLMNVPYGKTKSYAEQALAIGKPKSFRAVANANGANQMAIIIPCHRIINSSGNLGGYGGGLNRKSWLLAHEKKNLGL